MKRKTVLLMVGLLVMGVVTALADTTCPVGASETCQQYDPNDFTVSFYETTDNTPNGLPTETGPLVQLPSAVFPGSIIVLEYGTPWSDRNNSENWSDILNLTTTGCLFNWTSFGQLFSQGAAGFGETLPGDLEYIWEDSLGNATYTVQWWALGETGNTFLQSNTYHIYSSEETPVPEPTSLLLLGTGLASLAGYIRLRVGSKL
jgi:PEP-CTERM motif